MNPEFFRNNICFTCKDITKQPVKHCVKCRRVPYCCREHQVADWDNHKEICKTMAKARTVVPYDPKNFFGVQTYIQQSGAVWQELLNRKLTKIECQMGMHPRFCAVCYIRDDLFPCDKCLSVCYCSKEHQTKHWEKHEKYCKIFKLSLDIDCYFYKNFPEDPKNVLRLKNLDEETKGSLESFIDVFERLDLDLPSEQANINYIHHSDQVLSGLTVLYGLQMTGVLTSHELLKKTLVLHFVGASELELSLNWALIAETFVHWIFNLEQIDIALIGPELNDIPESELNLTEHFCDNCHLKKLDVNIHFHKCCYHEVVNNVPKPDLVIVFNSGVHEEWNTQLNTWKKSVSSLIKHDVPLMFTAYTFREIKKDLKVIDNETKLVWGPAKNPFANLRPFADWNSGTIPIYYINNFLAILKKK